MTSGTRTFLVLYEAAFGGVELLAESAQEQGFVVELIVLGAGGPALPRLDIAPCREVGGDAVEYVPARSPERLAERIAALAGDSARRKQLGTAACERASECFRAKRHLADFLCIAAT